LPGVGEARFQFSETNIWKIVLYTRALKQFLFEEIRRIYLLWEIVKYAGKFALNV
jgi:hypothetical protein